MRFWPAALLLLFSLPSWADTCGPRKEVLEFLQARYHERPVAAGRIGDHKVEIIASEDGHTWSLLIVNPDGRACFFMDGEDWASKTIPGKDL